MGISVSDAKRIQRLLPIYLRQQNILCQNCWNISVGRKPRRGSDVMLRFGYVATILLRNIVGDVLAAKVKNHFQEISLDVLNKMFVNFKGSRGSIATIRTFLSQSAFKRLIKYSCRSRRCKNVNRY